MITQKYTIYDWDVIILYLVDIDDFEVIQRHLLDIQCPKQFIKEGLDNIQTNKVNVGFTYSNINLNSSVIVISKVTSEGQFINTLSHECYHFIDHLTKLKNATQEEKATLFGNVMQLFYRHFKIIIA